MPAYEHAQMKGGGGGGDDKPPKKKEWQGTARQPRKIKDTKSVRKATRSGRTSAQKPRTWLHNPTPSGKIIERSLRGIEGVGEVVREGAKAGKHLAGREVKRAKRVFRHAFRD